MTDKTAFDTALEKRYSEAVEADVSELSESNMLLIKTGDELKRISLSTLLQFLRENL